jgi:hypothetical protein
MLDSLLGDGLLGAIAGQLILSILALMPPVAYIAIIVHTWHLADLLNRRLDWAAAAIGLPYVAPQALTFLRAFPNRASREQTLWEVAALGLSLILVQVGLCYLLLWNNEHDRGTTALAAAAVLFAVRVAYDFARGGPLVRAGMVGYALFAGWFGYSCVRELFADPQSLSDGTLWVFTFWVFTFYWAIVAALAAFIVGREARRRCTVSWRRWGWLSFAGPFITPLIFGLLPTPRIGNTRAAPLVGEFGEIFEGLVEAETRRRAENGLDLSGMAIAEVAVDGARNAVMVKHTLTPEEAERVVERYALLFGKGQSPAPTTDPAFRAITGGLYEQDTGESVGLYPTSASGPATGTTPPSLRQETEFERRCQKCGALMPDSKANRRLGICKACRREQARGRGDGQRAASGHPALTTSSNPQQGIDVQQSLAYLQSEEFSTAVRQAMEDRDQAARDGWIRQGRPGAGQSHRCKMCGKTIYGEETVIEMQRQAIYGEADGPSAAQQWERDSGYRCKSCGSEYCKDCLEKKAPNNAYGGKSCPSCYGLFEIIHG